MSQEQEASKRSQRPVLRNRKGWKGFVWGYKDWVKATTDEGRWDLVNWGENGKRSGAKSVRREGTKTIYQY